MTDEDREKFDGDIGMTESSEAAARDALLRHQKDMGITFENPDAPVTAEPGTVDENYG